LRGYRIELGDIEAALRSHPDVREAAVALQGEVPDRGRLVGYIVAEKSSISNAPVGQKTDDAPEFWPSLGPYQLYDEFLYDLMSSEAQRIHQYRKAFDRSVRDRIVLDIGCGEHALLARMCIEAGARRVYAVEVLKDACQKARALVERHGLGDRIVVIHGDMASVTLPEKVDVCTQGIIGNIGSADGIVPIWNVARRFFKPGCIPVPTRCRTMIAAVELPEQLRTGPGFSRLARSYAERAFEKIGRSFDIRLCVQNFPTTGIISDAHVFEDLDFTGELSPVTVGEALFTIDRPGRFDGFLVWTVVTTCGDEAVDYFMNQQAWLPVFFPLSDQGVPLSVNDRVTARWDARITSGIYPDYEIIARIEGGENPDREYSYRSRHDETALNSTALHRALWRTPNIPATDISPSIMKSWLSDRLPDYMIPTAWVQLDELPLTINSKLDRASLPAPTRGRSEFDSVFEAPRSELERDLTALWSEILGVDEIGVNDNFFDLGGDSISAVRLTSAMQRLLDDAVLLVAIFDTPTVGGLARYLTTHHHDTVTARYAGEPLTMQRTTAPGPESEPAPLSFSQQSFWLLEQLYPGRTAANEQFVIPLDAGFDATLDVKSLADAWNALIRRHDILRTTFRVIDDEVRQVVKSAGTVLMPVTDCSDLGSITEQWALMSAAAEADINRRFDLQAGPLINARLFRFSDRSGCLLVNAHHIIADGLSVRIIRDELAALYEDATGGQSATLPEPAAQYRAFAESQRDTLDNRRLEESLSFWRETLCDAPREVSLPYRGVTEAPATQRRTEFRIDSELADRLRGFARQANATMFMTLLAAFRALLFRYSNQDDISIGSPVTWRDSDVTRDMVGCLVNNVVFRTAMDGDPSFSELLRRERKTALAAFQHRDAPFEKVVEALQPARRFGQHPLFQVLFLFESGRRTSAFGGGVKFGLTTLESERCSYWELEFSLTDCGDGEPVHGFIGYATALFDAWFAEAIPDRFINLLAELMAQPDAPISTLSLLNKSERRHITTDRNATRQDYPQCDTLSSLFAVQAHCNPDSIAVVTDTGCLSYRELDRRTNRLARFLRQSGVGTGTLVGIGVGRSVELVIGVLATLRTGAAYLPLDPAYPEARLRFMLEDSGVQVVLAGARLRETVGGSMAHIVRLDRFDWGRPDIAEQSIEVAAEPDDPAYVLYTSGSTGRPKGSVGLHRGAVNRCHWMWREYGFHAGDVFSLRTSLNFVDSVWEIFGPLIHGASLAIMPDRIVRDPQRLIEHLAAPGAGKQVTHLVVVPSLLAAMLEAEPQLGRRLPAIHTWISSGEPLTPALLQQFRAAAPDARLLNTYGTSEIWDATCFDTSRWEPGLARVPIGKPIANVRTYVLDQHMQPLPPGIAGELYIGGPGLGAGYLNQPELTAERFIPCPANLGEENVASRLYRTGDLARYLPGGDLECLGRADRQIKLRGIRMEPGEIEVILGSAPGVDQAAVDLRRDPSGEFQLVGYCVLSGRGNSERTFSGERSAWSPTEQARLRHHLQRQLPDAMVPAKLVALDELPLTPSGKIDRQALPEPHWADTATIFIPPVTETEKSIAALWNDVLGARRVGLHDDFFECGGHSLSATRLLARIRSAYAIDLTLQHLFDEPTVGAIAARVDELCGVRDSNSESPDSRVPELIRITRGGPLALSFGQERLWFLDQLDPCSAAYNIAFTVHLAGRLQTDALQAAMNRVVARHEILRTCFPSVAGKPRQQVLAKLDIPIEHEDLSAASDDEFHDRLAYLASRPFDIASGPLLRAQLIERGATENILLVVIHHIVSDGISNGILFAELAEHYDALLSGSPPELLDLPIQYADFSAWQRQYISGKQLDEQLEYWTRQLAGAPEAIGLPTDWPRPVEQRFRGAWLWRELTPERADALRELGRANGCTLFMVMLAAFDILLYRYSGQADIVVGTPVAGRGRTELEALIGLFINTVALRADLSGNSSFIGLLEQLRRVTLDAQANQELPFERLVETLQPDRTLSHAPVFQVMFNLTPIPERRRSAHGLEMNMGRLVDHGVATFDLTLSVGERADGLDLIYEYDSDLFRRETIDRLADHYEQLLTAILDRADRPISELPMLTAAETHMLRTGWNPEVVATSGRSDWLPAHRLFEARVDMDPDAVAMVAGDQRITYGQLDRRANRLAHRLRSLGVGPEVTVGLCIDRSVEMLVGILGIHKAGGAYVPLDPDYPVARLAEMLTSAAPLVLVAHSAVASRLPPLDVPVVWLDQDADTLATLPATRAALDVEPDHLAYVLFTSGSTGRAKGVMVTHANLVSVCKAWQTEYGLTSHDRHLQMAGFSFDVFTGDWVRALCSGGSLVLCPRMTLLEPDRLYALLRDERITCAEFVPAVMRLLMTYLSGSGEDLSFMRLVMVGSDAWFGTEYQQLRQLCGNDARLVNSYGTAETTIDSTWFEATGNGSDELLNHGSVPVGRPFDNSRVYICDAQLHLVPIGVPGEMCIGGAGVARGYLDDPRLTLERFVPDPFGGGGRLYRTGDRARHLSDGTIQLLGRIDQQIKLRGFRIEPGEIEAVLMAHPAIKTCAVLADAGPGDQPGGDQRLVAYVVAADATVDDAPRHDGADGPVDTDAVRVYLKARLPDYMVPACFVHLASLPLTPNGKLDRGSLPAPEWGSGSVAARVAPRGAGIHCSRRSWCRAFGTRWMSSYRCAGCSIRHHLPG